MFSRVVDMEVEVKIFLWREKDMYVAWEPQTGVVSQGKTFEEALKNVKEAIELYLEDPDAELPEPISEVILATVKVKIPAKAKAIVS